VASLILFNEKFKVIPKESHIGKEKRRKSAITSLVSFPLFCKKNNQKLLIFASKLVENIYVNCHIS